MFHPLSRNVWPNPVVLVKGSCRNWFAAMLFTETAEGSMHSSSGSSSRGKSKRKRNPINKRRKKKVEEEEEEGRRLATKPREKKSRQGDFQMINAQVIKSATLYFVIRSLGLSEYLKNELIWVGWLQGFNLQPLELHIVWATSRLACWFSWLVLTDENLLLGLAALLLMDVRGAMEGIVCILDSDGMVGKGGEPTPTQSEGQLTLAPWPLLNGLCLLRPLKLLAELMAGEAEAAAAAATAATSVVWSDLFPGLESIFGKCPEEDKSAVATGIVLRKLPVDTLTLTTSLHWHFTLDFCFIQHSKKTYLSTSFFRTLGFQVIHCVKSLHFVFLKKGLEKPFQWLNKESCFNFNFHQM